MSNQQDKNSENTQEAPLTEPSSIQIQAKKQGSLSYRKVLFGSGLIIVAYWLSQQSAITNYFEDKGYFSSISKIKVSVQSSKPGLVEKIKNALPEESNAQERYYQAINLLNEGHEDEALKSLKSIIEDFPHFNAAKTTYSNLVALSDKK